MNLEQALKRIEELEERVRKLEAEPKEVHHHYPPNQYPSYPQPLPQWWPTPVVCCVDSPRPPE